MRWPSDEGAILHLPGDDTQTAAAVEGEAVTGAIMGRNSKIEWTHHTFNSWWGCTKVSAACKHCYAAEAWAKRVASNVWGATAPRRFFSNSQWRQPLAWDQEARAASGERWPADIWLGATVESQRWAERRISALAACQARIRFLSCESLLAALDLRPWLGEVVHWVIAGGERGPRPRPSHPRRMRDLRDQCVTARVPFLFKQWGSWAPLNGHRTGSASRTLRLSNGETMIRLSKKGAGRVLDGEVWDEVP